MKLFVKHKTIYQFSQYVPMGLQRLRLSPVEMRGQSVAEWQVTLEGATKELSYTDGFGNKTLLTKFAPEASLVSIDVQGVVETSDTSGIIGNSTHHIPSWLYRRQTSQTTAGKELLEFAKGFKAFDGSVAMLHEIMQAIREKVKYEIGVTDVETPAEEAWQNGAGVCQDHAHIMIAIARVLGCQARYVSGYLLINGVVDQDATHAWCEVYLDGLGWTGFDVSNGISPDERYIRLAVGRDYKDAAPIQGLRYGDAHEVLDVSLQINQ